MQKLYVRVHPGAGLDRFYRAGLRFDVNWLVVTVETEVADVLAAEPALEVSSVHPGELVLNNAPRAAPAGLAETASFTKPGRGPCLVKTGPQSLSLAAGTMAVVGGVPMVFGADTPVVMPVLLAGTDYAVYVCVDGTVRADANFTLPVGYTAQESRKIGGFHYGLTAPGETPAGGGFNTATSAPLASMVWSQSDVDAIAGINQYSLWDLAYRPACSDPRGMVCVLGRFWVDLYFTGTNHIVNGTSKAGSDLASGSVLAKIPVAFGGDGSAAYTSLTWYEAAEIAYSAGKRLLSYQEFAAAAFGVTENQSLGGAAETPPATVRQPGYTSRYGIEQATGHVNTWGNNAHVSGGSAWVSNPRRGNSYGTPYAARFGGNRNDGALSGSRSSGWNGIAWNSGWYIGLRCACDHLQLG